MKKLAVIVATGALAFGVTGCMNNPNSCNSSGKSKCAPKCKPHHHQQQNNPCCKRNKRQS